ncbi:MAG: hypothetical protein WDZ91_14190 [Paenibacillaceae bacterium]
MTFLEKWVQHPIIQKDPITAALWMEALQHYEAIHRALLQLYPSFPYGMPGVQIDIREHTIRLLSQAKEAEEKGIALLEKIYLQLVRYT